MKQIRETSMQIARQLIDLAQIQNGQTVLEPSAGIGNIINCLTNNYTFENLQIDCVELNKQKFLELQLKGYNAFNNDFLQLNAGKQYDRVIICPPFKGNEPLNQLHRLRILNNNN